MTLPHVQRMQEEISALNEKIEKLEGFINTNPTFSTLEGGDQSLLREQLQHMQSYARVLVERIARAIAG